MGYTCAVCGGHHDELPLGWGFGLPLGVEDRLSALAPDVMERRHWLVVDELLTAKDDARTRHFFVKGNLEVPIVDHEDDLVFTVWSTLDQETAFRAIDLWFDDARVEEPPAAGYLQNDVPLFHEPSLNLPCTVHWRPPAVRPAVVVQGHDHPLCAAQREGVTLARAAELAAAALHA